MRPQKVIAFWFEELSPSQWFKKDPELDAEIRNRFGETYERVVRGETASWREIPKGRLAEVLVLDQFSRNMFRGEAKAFAADPLALRLAKEAIRSGDDKTLPKRMRHFLYMPFMHSESRADHRQALWLFFSLLPEGWRALLFEWKHWRIIARFGRYPHRNAVLGRESTPEEKVFLEGHSGF